MAHGPIGIFLIKIILSYKASRGVFSPCTIFDASCVLVIVSLMITYFCFDFLHTRLNGHDLGVICQGKLY